MEISDSPGEMEAEPAFKVIYDITSFFMTLVFERIITLGYIVQNQFVEERYRRRKLEDLMGYINLDNNKSVWLIN